MSGLVSIIVPVYKTEKYLKKCLDSLIAQTYKNIEIVLVDDGSPDKCGLICDDYAKSDDRIVVIHKENGGVAAARNTGLSVAKGEYIVFCDSDDYVEKNFIEVLYQSITSSKADIAVCGFYKEYPDGKLSANDNRKKSILMTVDHAINKMFNKRGIQGFVCNKMFIRNKIKDIYFIENMPFCEDMMFTARVLKQSENIIYTTMPLYHYLQHSMGTHINKDLKYNESGDKYSVITLNYMLNECEISKRSIRYLRGTIYSVSRVDLMSLNKEDKIKYEKLRYNVSQHKWCFWINPDIMIDQKARILAKITIPLSWLRVIGKILKK